MRKFWIVTVGLASAEILASWVFQLYETYRQTIQGDNDFFARFVNEVVDANDDKALKLSEFFMRVSATDDGQRRWQSFRDFIQGRIDARKQAEQKVLQAGEARAILARQEELRANFVRLSEELDTRRNDASLINRLVGAEVKIQELQGELDTKLGQVRAAQNVIDALGPQTSDLRRSTTEAITVVGPSDPPWLQIAFRELDADIREQPGAGSHDPRILEYLESTRVPSKDDETPWQAAFVNWVMKQAGYLGTDSGLARSWLTWGLPVAQPIRGCIAVFSRASQPNARPRRDST